jgi:hypothetical protein
MSGLTRVDLEHILAIAEGESPIRPNDCDGCRRLVDHVKEALAADASEAPR